MMLLNSKSHPRVAAAAAGLSAAFVIWNSLFTTQFESGKSSAADKPDAEVKITAFEEITA
jgi:hypothetical protein